MKQQGGRPRGYTLDQVREAVAALVGRGAQLGALTAAAVKIELCEAHGVTQGIDPRSLDDALAQVRAEREEAERRALLQALPAPVAPAMAEAMSRLQQDLLLILAHEHARCLSAAEAECVELRRDKENANWRVRELQRDLETRAEEAAVLAAERDDARARRDALEREVETLRAALVETERESGALGRLVAELRAPGARAEIRALLGDILAEATLTEATH